MATIFYPSITDILPVDALPNELGFVKDGVSALLGKIYYKNLQYAVNDRGDTAFYSLSIVSLKRIDIEIPGTGLFLILNPASDPANVDAISEFPVQVHYEWPILGYLHNFDLSTFSFAPGDFFDLALTILDVTEHQLIEQVLNIFITGPDPINTFVNDLNSKFGTNIPLPTGPDPIEEVLQEIDNGAGIENVGAAIFPIYLLDAFSESNTEERVNEFFRSFYGGDITGYIKNLLIPKINATLEVNAAIEFPRNILTPLDEIGGSPLSDTTIKTMLVFKGGDLFYSTQGGIGFDKELNVELNHPSRIGNTGLGISLDTAKLDISRTENIPEADADGRPVDFVGVYIKEASISFPQFWNHEVNDSTGVIMGRKMIIGTGGFSGTLALEAKAAGETAPLIKVKFGDNFRVSIDRFSITLKQNSITGSSIEGTLRIPGFKDAHDNPADIRVKVAIHNDGDFDITAYEDDGFNEIRLKDIFAITIKTIFFGKKDGDFYLGISGCIRFLESTLSGLLKGDICVEKLLIWSDGRIEIEGGTSPLPEGAVIKIGPAKIAITAIHFGSYQQEHEGIMRKYRCFGFDGGLNLNPGGVDARGEGINFYYSVDSYDLHTFLRIQSISIDLIIPGNASKETATALISGYLTIKEDGSGKAYEGEVKFSLPKAKIAGGASMKYRPKEPAWIVDAFVELAVPLPLGATGLGIYGFRGLLGHGYTASRDVTGSDTWFDYYKAPPEEGVVVAKFKSPLDTESDSNPFSVGAGVSLATAADNGKAFSLKLFLLLSLPEVFYLEGKANVLGTRVGLTGDDPPFFAILAISANSVETGFGADYKLPDSGLILKLYAEIQAGFFFADPKAWYINFGTENKRIQARLLSLFNASSYLMLSASGIKGGAGADWGFEKKYAGGAVRASAKIYIEVGGFISFERPQIGGFAMVGGHVDAFLLFFGFHIGINTSLSVEAPKPFTISGSVHLCLGVTIGFWKFKKRIKKCFDVKFIWEKDDTIDTAPVIPFTFDTADVVERPPFKAINMLSGEDFDLHFFGDSVPSANDPDYNEAVIPLDTWIDIEFTKGLLYAAIDDKIGGFANVSENYREQIPPDPNSKMVTHQYTIKDIEIKAWNGSSWVDYHPFAAMAEPDDLAALGANPSDYHLGHWQLMGKTHNKIRLLAETPFSYMQQGQPGWYTPEQFGITSATLFCETQLREKHCLRWLNIERNRVYDNGQWYQVEGVFFSVVGKDGQVIDRSSHFNIPRSVVFAQEAHMEVVFSKPCAEVDLKITTFTTGIDIKFYSRKRENGIDIYTLVESRSLTRFELLMPVHYNDPYKSIGKVTIHPDHPDPGEIDKLKIKINALYRQYYESKEPNPKILEEIRKWEEELDDLIRQYCDGKGFSIRDLNIRIEQLEDQLKECEEQFVKITQRRDEVCEQYQRLRKQFEDCFPTVPGDLSDEVNNEKDCPVCLDHLESMITGDKCSGFIRDILDAREAFCKRYASLYCQLYQCSRDILQKWEKSCNELDDEEGQHRHKCDEIKELIEWIHIVIQWIEKGGFGDPPTDAPCATLVHEVCCLTLEDYQFNIHVPGQDALEESYQETVEAVEKMLKPIWRPDTKYYVHLNIEDEVWTDPANKVQHDRDYYFGFRTAGPVGYFHKDPDAGYVPNEEDPDQFMLTSLRPYIDYLRSYPNADGDLVRAKPLFYEDARILLFYVDRFVYHMFGNWPAYNGLPALVGARLQVVVKDPVEDVTIENPAPPEVTTTEIPEAVESWLTDNDPRIPEDIRTLLNLRNPELLNPDFAGGECWPSGGDMIRPASVYTQVTLRYLKPLKLYTTIFNNLYRDQSEQVHRYVFQTSRYADFSQQVNSYHLDDGKGNTGDAIFQLPVDLSNSGIDLGYDVVTNNLSTGHQQLIPSYADPFDRLIEGAWQLPPLDAAVTTEFNVLRQESSGKVFAIWIRNPEPFNDPKIADTELARSLNVLNGSIPDTAYRVLFSKDRSQAVIMNNSKNITGSNLRFRFIYLEWDGRTYADRVTVNVGPISLLS